MTTASSLVRAQADRMTGIWQTLSLSLIQRLQMPISSQTLLNQGTTATITSLRLSQEMVLEALWTPKSGAHRMTLPRSQTLSQWTQTRRLSQIQSLVTRAIALLRSTTLRLQTRPSSTISSNRKRETLEKMSNASSDMWSRLEAKTSRRINAGKMWWALSKNSKPPLAMTLSLWKTVLCKSNLQIRLQVSRPF